MRGFRRNRPTDYFRVGHREVVTRDNGTFYSFIAGDSWSLNSVTGVITWINGTNGNGTLVNVTYTWTCPIYSHAYNVSVKGETGLATYGDWFNIIVILSILTVLLAFLFVDFRQTGTGVIAAISCRRRPA